MGWRVGQQEERKTFLLLHLEAEYWISGKWHQTVNNTLSGTINNYGQFYIACICSAEYSLGSNSLLSTLALPFSIPMNWDAIWCLTIAGLWLDLLVSLILKTSVRRQRPAHNINDMFGTVSVDCYSFPSGHATRAGMLACIFIVHFSLDVLHSCFCVAWMALVAASRIALGRHHVLDVTCGLLIGLLQYYALVNWLWLSQETCEAIILPVLEELHLWSNSISRIANAFFFFFKLSFQEVA